MKCFPGLACLLLFCIFQFACVSAPEGGATPGGARRDGPVRIGFSMATLKEERWQRDFDAFTARCAERRLVCDITVANNSAEKQFADVEQLLTKGVDVLVVAPHDASQASRIVDRAAASGVPVISYDRLILSDRIALYISHQIAVVGDLMARYVLEKVPRGNYVLVFGGDTDNNARIIRDVQKNVLASAIERGDVKIVDEQFINDWSPDLALNFAENALTKSGGDVQVFLVSNDGMAGGVIAALRKRGLAGKVVVTGQDAQLSALRNIAEGAQSMTVYKPIAPLARAAADAAASIAEGRPVEGTAPFEFTVGERKASVQAKLLEVRIVERGNIDETVVRDGHAKREDIFAARQ